MAKIDVFNMAEGGKMCYFWCIGCEETHGFSVGVALSPSWTWNNDIDKPDVSPSLLIDANRKERRCHLFIRDGKIQYLSDCHHELAGQTVDMVDCELGD